MCPKIESGDICQHIRELQQIMKLIQSKIIDLQIQLLAGEFESSVLNQIQSNIDELNSMVNYSNSVLERISEVNVEDRQFSRLETSNRNENLKEREWRDH